MQSLEVSKTREKNKKNFEKCWLSIINKGNISKFFLLNTHYEYISTVHTKYTLKKGKKKSAQLPCVLYVNVEFFPRN
jgi:hypothetical protein